jgi:hypothetical protein
MEWGGGGEREEYGFPLINCHSFPGYFVRKTCPGEKEFPLVPVLKPSSYPEIRKGIPFPLLSHRTLLALSGCHLQQRGQNKGQTQESL